MGSAQSRTRLQRLSMHACLGEGNGNHSSIPAWRIPGTEEPGGLPSVGSAQSRARLKRLSSSSRGIVRGRETRRAAQSVESQRVRYDLATEQQQRSRRPPEPGTHGNFRGSPSSSSWSSSRPYPSSLACPSSLSPPPSRPPRPSPRSDPGLPGVWNAGLPLAAGIPPRFVTASASVSAEGASPLSWSPTGSPGSRRAAALPVRSPPPPPPRGVDSGLQAAGGGKCTLLTPGLRCRSAQPGLVCVHARAGGKGGLWLCA